MRGDIWNSRKLSSSTKTLIVCWWFFYGICQASVKENRSDIHWLNGNITDKERLRSDLLLRYDSYTLPDYKNTNEIIIIMVFNFAELDYAKNIISVNGISVLSWNDKRLTWNPKDYNDIENLRFDNEEIWKPDLALYNSADNNLNEDFGKTNIVCHYNGSVTWVTPSLFRAFCPIDVLNWPFDTQVCELKFGSWTYDGTKIDLKIRNTGPQTDGLYSSEWIIKRVVSRKNSIRYQCCPEDYIDVTYSITLQREHSSFKMFVILPVFALAILTLSLFWIPPQSSVKFILAGANIIMSCLLLTFYGEKVPIMLHKVPLIVRFYDNIFCLTTLYTIFCAVTYVVAEPGFRSRTAVPSAGALLLDSCILNYLTFPSEKNLKNALTSGGLEENGRNPIVEDENEINADQINGVEWFLLFVIVNRAWCIMYSIILTILLFRIVMLIENE